MKAVCVLLLIAAVATYAKPSASPLPKYNAHANETTVSGLSSGGYMAVQVHVAFSKTIKGAAIFAGGPYDCAGGSEITALTTCMSAEPSPPSPAVSILVTDARASAGEIDPVAGLTDSFVYLYSGTLDSTVNPKVMAALDQYYANYLPADSLVFIDNVTSAHTQPTDDSVNTNPCWLSVSPYISDCSYDGAGAALNHIYGAPLPNPRNDGTLGGNVISFDQNSLVPGGIASLYSLSDTGFAYVPAACASGQACKIHVAFHGCEQNFQSVLFDYVTHTGYNKWADTNNIVVVYPQTVNSDLSPSNPNGCWDWWGQNFTGSNYDMQTGPQMQFFMNLVKQATQANADAAAAPAAPARPSVAVM